MSENEPPRDKINKVSVRPAKTQVNLGIRPVWSESSLSAWRTLGSLASHWAHSEDSDQTGRMPRLIWVFAGRTATVLVLSRGGSNVVRYYYVNASAWRLRVSYPTICLAKNSEHLPTKFDEDQKDATALPVASLWLISAFGKPFGNIVVNVQP